MSLWRGGLWNSLQSVNGVGPWRGSLWRSEQDSTALAIKKLLFSEGQQGVFYVPQPKVFGKQVLFQDNNGTTPVTADGQPVGLMLDLRLGVVRGPELARDPSLDDPASWTFDDPSEWDTSVVGQFTITNAATRNDATPESLPALDIGQTYEITVEYENVSGSFLIYYPNAGSFPLPSGSGTISYKVKAGELQYFILSPRAGASGTIKFYGARKIPGNHATQSTAANKPLYAITPDQLDFDAVDDAMSVTFPTSLGSDVTIGRAVPGVGGSILTGQTVGTSYSITEDMAALVIVDEALSADDTSKLQNYLDAISGV